MLPVRNYLYCNYTVSTTSLYSGGNRLNKYSAVVLFEFSFREAKGDHDTNIVCVFEAGRKTPWS